jgi:hypothetical protein
MKKASALLLVFVTTPIWYYLLYSILVAINATDLQFFLFWVYVPVSLLVSYVIKVMEE